MPRKESYWTNRLFIEQAELYAAVLEALKPAGLQDARSIRRIFDDSGVPRTGRVLDFACGIGRHIVPLVKGGYRGVGADFSPPFVAKAADYARRARLGPNRLRFFVADYRVVDRTLRNHNERPFDAAFSVFTSLGHYGTKGDLTTLRSVRRVVRPGGVLLIEMANRDWVLRHFERIGSAGIAPSVEIRERRRFDWESSTVSSDWIFYRIRAGRREKALQQEVRVRLYSLHELKSLVEQAGWRFLKAYGGLDRSGPLSFESRRLVVVARNGQ